jgi:hypothetical protein
MFLPVGIDHLLFTHMDEYGIDDSLLDLIKKYQLPSAFYTDGVDLFDHLQETDVVGFKRFSSPKASKRKPMTDTLTKPISSNVEKTNHHHHGYGDATHFVAHRNSELFHHPDCKSVMRINADKITAFRSFEQALGEGFKPCHACCSVEMIKSAVPGVFDHRRVSAI